MHAPRKIVTFNNRYPLVGPSFWIVSIQYFITQLIVAWNWAQPYSLSKNAISDLGNTVCANYGDRYVCSPLHDWMNASFIVLGIFMIAGSGLIYQEFRKNTGSFIGFNFMALAGIGTVLVGLFPENTVTSLHSFGAAMPFFIGNLALVIFGFALEIPRVLRFYTLLSGFVALIALVLLINKNYLGIGLGGMERIVAYPQTVWLIVFGIYMSSDRFRALASKAMSRLHQSY